MSHSLIILNAQMSFFFLKVHWYKLVKFVNKRRPYLPNYVKYVCETAIVYFEHS